MRSITRLETPAEVTNQLETRGHLMAFMVIDQSKVSSCPYMSRQWLTKHSIVNLRRERVTVVILCVYVCYQFKYYVARLQVEKGPIRLLLVCLTNETCGFRHQRLIQKLW